MSTLGYCSQCQGPLCVAGDDVACERCGQPVPEHPLKQAHAARPRPTAEPFTILPDAYAPGDRDRLNALEKRVAVLEAATARVRPLSLEEQVADVERRTASARGKKGPP